MIFGEDDPKPQTPSPQQIRLDASGMETVYANSFALTSSAEELTVYLGVNAPLPGMKQPTVKISHRLVLIPQHAKRLTQVLEQTIKAYEDRFGPIELPPASRPPQTRENG